MFPGVHRVYEENVAEKINACLQQHILARYGPGPYHVGGARPVAYGMYFGVLPDHPRVLPKDLDSFFQLCDLTRAGLGAYAKYGGTAYGPDNKPDSIDIIARAPEEERARL